VHANIVTNSSDNSDYVGRVEARSGSITGSIQTRAISPRLFGVETTCYVKASGDLDADVTVRRAVTRNNGSLPVIDIGGQLPANRLLSIGTSLEGPVGGNLGGLAVSAGGLKGQVIINSGNTTGAWAGSVKVGATTLNPIPEYASTATSIGGGSVGLAPFRLHDSACVPPNTPPNPPQFLTSRFSQLPPLSGPGYDYDSIVLDFYGPVWTDFTGQPNPPLTVISETGPVNNYAMQMTVEIARSDAAPYSRFITIHGDGVTLLPAGRYHIRPLKAGAAIIQPRCAALAVPNVVPVGEDFDYVFDLVADCNRNGVDDVVDIAADAALDIFPHNDKIDACECNLDYNTDGNVDQADVDCIIDAIAGGHACADIPDGAFLDFAEDGNLDQDDVDVFINAVASGACPWQGY